MLFDLSLEIIKKETSGEYQTLYLRELAFYVCYVVSTAELCQCLRVEGLEVLGMTLEYDVIILVVELSACLLHRRCHGRGAAAKHADCPSTLKHVDTEV